GSGDAGRGGGDSPPSSGGPPNGRAGNGPTISGAALGGLGRLLPRALQPKTDDTKPARPTTATPHLPSTAKAPPRSDANASSGQEGDHAGESAASEAEVVKKNLPVPAPKGKSTDGGSGSGSSTTESSSEESVETHDFRRAGGWKRLETEDKGAMEAGVG